MHCSEFHDQHCAYVDDTLAGVEIVRMQGHLAECPRCAALDTRVRRSLMVARSLPTIELSSDFGLRLEAKLRECRRQSETSCVNFKVIAAVGAVASVLMLGYLATSLRKPHDIIFPPVIAMAEPPQPEIAPNGVAGVPVPAILASVSAGMPIWPAALFAEQAPLHFASYRQVH